MIGGVHCPISNCLWNLGAISQDAPVLASGPLLDSGARSTLLHIHWLREVLFSFLILLNVCVVY
jgi:hypothetical protein